MKILKIKRKQNAILSPDTHYQAHKIIRTGQKPMKSSICTQIFKNSCKDISHYPSQENFPGFEEYNP